MLSYIDLFGFRLDTVHIVSVECALLSEAHHNKTVYVTVKLIQLFQKLLERILMFLLQISMRLNALTTKKCPHFGVIFDII